MKNNLDVQDICHYIPQRYPFLMIDRVTKLTENHITAIKNVTVNEPFFNGHFPGKPVMPGVLIIEALAQTASLLSFKVLKKNELTETEVFYLAGVDNVRFKQIVVPGDQLILQIGLDRHKGSIWKYKGTAIVEDRVVCTADIIGYYESNGATKKNSAGLEDITT